MQNDSIDNIRLDINNQKVNGCLYMRQGDTKTRTVHITLVDSGIPVDLTNAIFCEILIKRPDGTESDNSVVRVGNEIQYTLRTTDLSVVGTSDCQIMITYSDGSILTSPTFNLIVYSKTLDQRTQTSMNEYTAITAQLVDATARAKEAATSATNAATSATQAAESATNASESEENASESATNASESATSANESATNAAESEANAKSYMESAESYKDEAGTSATNAETSATSASASADSANESATICEGDKVICEDAKDVIEQHEHTCENNAKKSESYAVGDTDYREGEATDNSMYYYQQAKIIAESFSGAMIFVSSLTFANLPDLAIETAGHQYNVEDEFTTDERFIEGSGIEKGAGTDVVCVTYNGEKKWNCLSGVTVHGVKGNAEEVYRKGLVNLTPTNLGLGNVDNTSDADKPISTATQSALDTISGDLSTHTSDTTVHITSDERTAWNKVISDLSDLTTEVNTLKAMLGYPMTRSEE